MWNRQTVYNTDIGLGLSVSFITPSPLTLKFHRINSRIFVEKLSNLKSWQVASAHDVTEIENAQLLLLFGYISASPVSTAWCAVVSDRARWSKVSGSCRDSRDAWREQVLADLSIHLTLGLAQRHPPAPCATWPWLSHVMYRPTQIWIH